MNFLLFIINIILVRNVQSVFHGIPNNNNAAVINQFVINPGSSY